MLTDAVPTDLPVLTADDVDGCVAAVTRHDALLCYESLDENDLYSYYGNVAPLVWSIDHDYAAILNKHGSQYKDGNINTNHINTSVYHDAYYMAHYKAFYNLYHNMYHNLYRSVHHNVHHNVRSASLDDSVNVTDPAWQPLQSCVLHGAECGTECGTKLVRKRRTVQPPVFLGKRKRAA